MLINLAALVVVIAGIMAAKSILIPFLPASFLAIICAPPLYWLRTKGYGLGSRAFSIGCFHFHGLLGLGTRAAGMLFSVPLTMTLKIAPGYSEHTRHISPASWFKE